MKRLLLLFILSFSNYINADETSIYDLTLEELLEVRIASATLTEVETREIPGAVTVIDKSMIDSAKARSLNELLEIYVPNIQVIRHHWESDHLGVRGIMNDREDKYLLLVNGRNMNQKTHTGAQSERDIPLLGDIHRVEVIRGPASAIYGPGAISMVINIITESAYTFKGNELIVTGGAGEEFGTVEFKYGLKIDQDSGLYFYLGLGKYSGAQSSEAPEKLSFNDTTFFGDNIQSGQPVSYDTGRDYHSHEGKPDVKVHLNFKKGNWDNWIRFTKGGRDYTFAYPLLFPPPRGWNEAPPYSTIDESSIPSSGYQHLTLLSSYLHEIRDDLSLKYTLSFDTQEFSRDHWYLDQSFREDEIYAQIMANWDAAENHKFALGVEGSYEEFGRDSKAYDAETNTPSPWSTDTYSLIGEYQWDITEKWLLFLGGRTDEHSYTDTMHSPRGSLIYKATESDTFKFIMSRSLRTNNATEMRQTYLNDGSDSYSEEITNYELRWEREHSSNLFFALSTYYHDMELIAYNENASRSTFVGDQSIYGAEIEIKYSKENFQAWFSHGYSKLDNLELADGVDRSLSSSEPNGYGDDLANWSNHITKLAMTYQFNHKFEVNSSLRILWGLQGHEDFANYELDTNTVPGYDRDNTRSFEESVFWNLGFRYKYSDKTTFSVNGYNLLGIFDEDLNKRNYYGSYGDSRSHAAAVSFSISHKF